MKSLRKNLQWLILGFLCLVLILVFSAFFIYQMNTMIYSTMLNSILELASHDMVSIENFLERNWLDLTGIHQRLIIYQCDSILSVQDRMNLERSSSNFQQLYLVAEDGTIYNSQYAVYPPDQMDIRSFLDTNEDHIVRHYDYLVSTGEQKEMLLYAITLDNFEIEGIRFTHMIGLTPINQIQSRMAIHSFFKNGVSRGYTSVVNLNGDYIVNIDRTVSVNQRKNIFSLLDEGKMDSPWTNEVIAEKMGADESFQFSYRDQTGVENFLYFTPINSAPWFLISSVEQSVFTDLSQRFIFSSISMVLITLILVSTLFVIIVRTRKRTLSAISDARAKSSFLSNMSHEIRTPLNGIIGLLHLIKSHLADGNQKQLSVWVQKADETSRYLLSLINDILDVSKLQSSKLTLNLAPFLLSPMLDSIETMQQEAAINHGVKLILEKDILVPCVIGDQMRIEQVLMNIVGNAVKFTPAGGTILLSAGQAMEPDGRVSTTITCTDTGIGMSQEYLKSIWDSFSQEHNAASNGTKGTGLGMFISKGIIDAMGGEISVSSELGKGSVFTIVFCSEVFSEAGPEAGPREVKKLLVAEDNELNAEILLTVLEDNGYEAVWAEDGAKAVEVFAQSTVGEFDVILMDMQMPNMDGCQATAAIRGMDRPDAGRVRIFACTANSFQEDINRALASGMNDFLPKPIDIGQLLEKLHM